MYRATFKQGQTYVNQPSYALPPRFQQPMMKPSLVHEPEIIYSTPLYYSEPTYTSTVGEPQRSPLSPQSENTSPTNSSPTNNLSPLSSPSSLLSELKPGPLTSLFYGKALKPLPVGSTLNILRCRPNVLPRDPHHSIWTTSGTEREAMCSSAPYFPTQSSPTAIRTASPFLRQQELDDLRRRLVREVTTNDRVGNPSLSDLIKKIEEATASRHKDNTASIALLSKFLTELIRDFSPRYTPAEVLPLITYWVDLKTRHEMKKRIMKKRAGRWNTSVDGFIENKRADRLNHFSPLKSALMQKIMDIWRPAMKEKTEKRFLTCHEYQAATHQLALGLPVNDRTADLLLRTVKGIDALRLFALLMGADCVAGEDVAVVGLSLAKDCIHDGYSFAFYELFEAAGDKLCRVGSEEIACEAMDVATSVMRRNKFKFEDLEFYIQTCYNVECYRLAQWNKWIGGAPKDGSIDSRPRRKEVWRKEDVRPFLPKYAALMNVNY